EPGDVGMAVRSARQRRGIRAVACLIIGAAAACSDATEVSVASPVRLPPPVDSSPPTGQIAFAGPKVGDDRQIYLMNADGSAMSPLTSGPGEHTDPAWSPDGTRVAFANATTGGIYVMNADGSGVRRIAATGENPAWSPDGGSIAYSAPDSS